LEYTGAPDDAHHPPGLLLIDSNTSTHHRQGS
jgi:hypothetical protein